MECNGFSFPHEHFLCGHMEITSFTVTRHLVVLILFLFPAAAEMKRNDKITELLQQRQEKDIRELNKVSHCLGPLLDRVQ